eukprot:722528-Prymnesium_polylepis.1
MRLPQTPRFIVATHPSPPRAARVRACSRFAVGSAMFAPQLGKLCSLVKMARNMYLSHETAWDQMARRAALSFLAVQALMLTIYFSVTASKEYREERLQVCRAAVCKR